MSGIVIAIDKSSQRMSVSVDGVQKYVWPVSTGRPGYATPSGTFRPFRMEVDHFSEEWDDAPMPNSIFFTPQGHAIHGSLATRRLGTAASHGCVRLAPKNAATLYALVQAKGMFNTRILISDRVASFGLSLNGYTPLAGGRLRAGVAVQRAVPILGASEAGDPLTSRPGTGSDYTVYRAWANWVGKLAGPVSARLAVNGQLASDPVLTIDQLTVGGPSFGRGYDFSERAGDKGVLASGELRSDVVDRNAGFLRWLQLYAFADAGSVRDLGDDFGTGDLYSAGAGARFKLADDLRLELEAAFPINEPRYDAGDKSPRLSATVGTEF